MVSWPSIALLLFFFRYTRLVVNIISHWTFKSIHPPKYPSINPNDVTIVLPTLNKDEDQLLQTIKSCLAARPHELIIVTVDTVLPSLERLVDTLSSKRITLYSIARPSKRGQLCAALPHVSTPITVLADDDVIWPRSLLSWMLAPFEDSKIGGVGTSQRLVRPDRLSIWSFLGALYLERRNFDCSACLNMDGGLPCLSGRTVAYRTDIIQDPAFLDGFANEKWRGNKLNADDDNFITRWTYSHGWQIAMQYHEACEVRTTLDDGPNYLRQCLRWSRSNWRSNITSIFIERHYCWRQPWTTYAVLQTTFTAWAFTDLVLFYVMYKATQTLPSHQQTALRVVSAAWIFVFAKTVKLLGHFKRYPTDILLLPISILFGQMHGIIKLTALLTLSATTWSSCAAADKNAADVKSKRSL